VSRYANKTALESGMKPAPTKRRSDAKDAGRSATTAATAQSSAALGNTAAASLLHDDAAATPIPPGIRARMERSFGVDLGAVRVHRGNVADSLDAEALVHGEDIHWGAAAPPLESPEAAPLLAHEVAHVVQQSRAGTIEDRVGSPGEASEIAADVAGAQASAGQTASVAGGVAVAGTQRQPKKDNDAETLKQEAISKLTAYLKKVVNTTPPQNIKKTKVARTALKRLAQSAGASAALFDVDAFVDAAGTSNDPATMATQFVSKVPNISKAALDQLENALFIDSQPGTLARVTDLVTGSAPGGLDRPSEPGYVSPSDKAQDLSDKLNAVLGRKKPTTIGPGSVDVLQLARIIKGIKPALKGTPTKPAAPVAEVYPSVTEAIKKMPADALIPAESKGKSDPAQWAETATFAEDLARRMDLAQKSKQTEVTVELGYNYATVKGRDALRDAVEAIIQQLRDALPHHATEVKHVKVTIAGKLLTVGIAQ
jgi:hypothetical protein